MTENNGILGNLIALPLFYDTLKYPFRVVLGRLRDLQDHYLFQSIDKAADILDLVGLGLYPSIIPITGSAFLLHAFHSRKPSSRHQVTAQPVLLDSKSRWIVTLPKAVQPDMATVKQCLYSPIESNIGSISIDHSLPRRDVVVSPDAIQLQDIMRVNIQCIGWCDNSCWWDAPSEAIYWTIRNDISTTLEPSLQATNRSATDLFSDYLHDRCKAEPTATVAVKRKLKTQKFRL